MRDHCRYPCARRPRHHESEGVRRFSEPEELLVRTISISTWEWRVDHLLVVFAPRTKVALFAAPMLPQELLHVGLGPAAPIEQLRVRHYGDVARVELDPGALMTAIERRAEVVAAVKASGYRYVTLDLEGFRSGNLNAAL